MRNKFMIVKLNRKVREHVILMLHEKRRHTNMLLEESGRGGGGYFGPQIFFLYLRLTKLPM